MAQYRLMPDNSFRIKNGNCTLVTSLSMLAVRLYRGETLVIDDIKAYGKLYAKRNKK